MNTFELTSSLEGAPEDDSMDQFGMGGFDINEAFQEAALGVASDNELALEEKIRRMEVIVNEGTSELYSDFIDFRQLAVQMEMMCSHDHAFNDALGQSEALSSFMSRHNDGDSQGSQANHENDEYEIDSKTGKKTKKKKRSGWLSILLNNL